MQIIKQDSVFVRTMTGKVDLVCAGFLGENEQDLALYFTEEFTEQYTQQCLVYHPFR